MKAIIGTLFRITVIILIFVAGYTLAHQKIPIPPIDKAIDKVTNYCGEKETNVKPGQ